jgi:hypothetical protein
MHDQAQIEALIYLEMLPDDPFVVVTAVTAVTRRIKFPQYQELRMAKGGQNLESRQLPR